MRITLNGDANEGKINLVVWDEISYTLWDDLRVVRWADVVVDDGLSHVLINSSMNRVKKLLVVTGK